MYVQNGVKPLVFQFFFTIPQFTLLAENTYDFFYPGLLSRYLWGLYDEKWWDLFYLYFGWDLGDGDWVWWKPVDVRLLVSL